MKNSPISCRAVSTFSAKNLSWLTVSFLIISCSGRFDGQIGQSRLANVSIAELENGEYTRYKFELIAHDNEGSSLDAQEFDRGEGRIELSVPAGKYEVILDYSNDERVVYSSRFCVGDLNNANRIFAPGPNDIVINICREDQVPIQRESEVSITPTLIDNNDNAGTSRVGETFSIKNGQLIDRTGHPFVMRGINNPHAYFRDQAYQALSHIKDFGFNSVRIVWCADNLERQGRCGKSHFHSPQELDRILSRMRELGLVAVFNLQNATGSNSESDLLTMVDYLVKPEVKQVLLHYQDMLLINIANEWYGTWNKSRDYVNGYKEAIPRLRSAGLPHVLIIDARGYGQDFSSVSEHAEELLALDSNIMISAHMYDVFDQESKVEEAFEFVRSRRIPFVVGEWGCSHGAGKTVACDEIMKQAEHEGYKVGTLAWSYTGNNSDVADLDVVYRSGDWRQLTPWGHKLVNTERYGIRATSKPACIFSPNHCR